MSEEIEKESVKRDIELCKKCKWFRVVDSDDGYDKEGIYRGKGVFCRNYFGFVGNTGPAQRYYYRRKKQGI